MKHTARIVSLILALLLALGALGALAEANGAVAIDKAHFPDAAFRRFVLQYDADGDQRLSAAERREVVAINVPDMGISSLRGIEYFTALRALSASGNKLRALDVSKNRQLSALLCDENRLASLDLSKNKQLLVLMCSGNRLSSLDLSKHKGLLAVTCENNRLRALTLGTKPNLETLRCQGNKLAAVDIKRCPNLRALLQNEPVAQDGALTWGEERNLVIDAATRLTAGKKTLFP